MVAGNVLSLRSSSEKSHQCAYCSEKLKTKSALTKHEYQKHNRQKGQRRSKSKVATPSTPQKKSIKPIYRVDEQEASPSTSFTTSFRAGPTTPLLSELDSSYSDGVSSTSQQLSDTFSFRASPATPLLSELDSSYSDGVSSTFQELSDNTLCSPSGYTSPTPAVRFTDDLTDTMPESVSAPSQGEFNETDLTTIAFTHAPLGQANTLAAQQLQSIMPTSEATDSASWDYYIAHGGEPSLLAFLYSPLPFLDTFLDATPPPPVEVAPYQYLADTFWS